MGDAGTGLEFLEIGAVFNVNRRCSITQPRSVHTMALVASAERRRHLEPVFGRSAVTACWASLPHSLTRCSTPSHSAQATMNSVLGSFRSDSKSSLSLLALGS